MCDVIEVISLKEGLLLLVVLVVGKMVLEKWDSVQLFLEMLTII